MFNFLVQIDSGSAAIIGALIGALIGNVVVALMSILSDRLKEKRGRTHDIYEERKKIYKDLFIYLIMLEREKESEKRDEIYNQIMIDYSNVALYGSKKVRNDLDVLIMEMNSNLHNANFTDKIENLIEDIRNELGIKDSVGS